MGHSLQPSVHPPPLVSVVMPLLRPHVVYFPQAVESILHQTLSDFELVIVEDPSPVRGSDYLARHADPRIRHIIQPERTSLTRQLNRGLAESRGGLIARMDADDIAEPDRLRRQVEFLRTHPDVGIVGTHVVTIDGSGAVIGRYTHPADHDGIVALLRRKCALVHPTVMGRREVFLDAGGYKLDILCEDYELWCRLASLGVRIANIPEPLLRYRRHGGNASSTRLLEAIRGEVRVKTQYWKGKMGPIDWAFYQFERTLLRLPPGIACPLYRGAARLSRWVDRG